MLARVSALLIAVPLIVAATAVPRGGGYGGPSVSQCNTGSLHCCNSVQSSNSQAIQSLLGILGIPLGPVTGQVGLNCTPLSVIGAGGNSCTAQPACCNGDTFSGLITIACTPVNINL